MEFDPAVFGRPLAVDVFSAAGDQTGSASFASNRLKASFSSRSGGIGRLPGVPILVVSIPVLGAAGAAADLRLIPSDVLWRDVKANQYAASADGVRFRAGGDLSIDAVTPGGGLLLEGTRVRIEGRGFGPDTAVNIDGVPLSSIQLIAPNAIDIHLAAPVDLTGRQVRIVNPNGESAGFYPALRPGMVAMPDGSFVQYMFPQQLFVSSTDYLFGVQNPYVEPVTATLAYPPLHAGLPSTSRSLNLAPGEVFYWWMDNSIPRPSGVSSTKPVRMGTSGILYATGVTTTATVGWAIPPPPCSAGAPHATGGTCWITAAGSGPATALLRIYSSTLAYVASAQSAPGDWLKVSPEQGTGGEITVTADPRSLAQGEYSGTVTISFGDERFAAVKIPITLRVAESVVDFRDAPPYFYFTGRHTDSPPPPIQVGVTATKDGTPFRIGVEYSGDAGWLLVSPREGVTPATLDITFDPRLWGPDFARAATIVLRGPSNTVTKTAGSNLTEPLIAIDSTQKTFWAKTGGSTPAAQTIGFQYYGYAGGCPDAVVISESTQSGGSWLKTARAERSGTITVSVNAAGLGAGTYEGEVSIAAPGGPQCPDAKIPVTLVVSDDDPAVAVEPAAIDLTGPSGSDSDAPASLIGAGYSPAVQGRVMLAERRNPVDFSFTSTTEVGIDWLVVSTDSAKAAGVLNVRGNATDLPPGTYRGSIRVNAPTGSKNIIDVPVTFRVGASLPVSPLSGPPLAAFLVNAASHAVGAIAPDELVTIHGVNLAPDQSWLPAPDKPGVRVLFDGHEAPVLYASLTQLNVITPAELTGKSSVAVAVESGGLRSVSGVSVAESAPGLFTADGSGAGQAAAFNLSSGDWNNARQPVARGAGIRLIATGLGRTSAETNEPVLPVSVKVADKKATVKRIAPSPAAMRGMFEVDISVPADIAPGPVVPVVIQAGSASSPERVTIAVK